VPTKGNPRHAFRFEPGLWRAFLDAVRRDPLGRNMAEVVRDLVAWYARQKRGEPVRPPRRD
jgi:hypothetical protein